MSTIFSFVEQWRRWIVLASTWCRIRWYLVLMCFVRSWNFGFLANFIVEVLSIKRGVECTCFSCKYSKIFLSHNFLRCFSCCHIFYFSCGICWNWLFAWPPGDNSWSQTHNITWSRYPSFFVSIEAWIRVSNQAEVDHPCILESKVLSSQSTLELFLQ